MDCKTTPFYGIRLGRARDQRSAIAIFGDPARQIAAHLVVAARLRWVQPVEQVRQPCAVFLRGTRNAQLRVRCRQRGLVVGEHFFTRVDGRRAATPLFLSLLLVESADAVFALDSIPAILAITRDPFIVYTSNVFAILGLRSLYFALAGMMEMFHYLHYGLSVILIFIGIKMLLIDIYKIPVLASLGVVIGILAVTMVWSVKTAPKIGPSKTAG